MDLVFCFCFLQTQAKTLIILGMLGPLDPSQAEAVEAAILEVAEGLTTGQLRARLHRLVLSVDPGAARRRREKAEKQAHVECWTDPEGTASLAGRYLPPAQVLAADRRLCAIATAWKKLGAEGGMDLLRAHAYLALLLGCFRNPYRRRASWKTCWSASTTGAGGAW